MEEVILVNEANQEIGSMEKMEAHEKGLLHRAFSVFIFNEQGELLLQRRASTKYHSGGLWTNTCCSHPRKGESLIDAASRRLQEEMGFAVDTNPIHSFIYRAELDNELTEHELDHILVGRYNDSPKLNLEEADDWKYVSLDVIQSDIQTNPEKYTAWFKIIFRESLDKLKPYA
jgi:isopentenyl-diphosphate delta-isomerase